MLRRIGVECGGGALFGLSAYAAQRDGDDQPIEQGADPPEDRDMVIGIHPPSVGSWLVEPLAADGGEEALHFPREALVAGIGEIGVGCDHRLRGGLCFTEEGHVPG